MRALGSDEIREFGERAAHLFTGDKVPLTEAVIQVLRGEDLSVEQIRRVCEEANVKAFLDEFKTEGSDRRNIVWPDGPAEPQVVVKEVKYGGETLPLAEKVMLKQAAVATTPVSCSAKSWEQDYALFYKQASVMAEMLREAESKYEDAKFYLAGQVKTAQAEATEHEIGQAIKEAVAADWCANLACHELGLPRGPYYTRGRLNENHPLVKAAQAFASAAVDYALKERGYREAEREFSDVIGRRR